MAVKVLIKRSVSPDQAKALIPLVRQMRASAATQAGYITGETLRSLDKPDEFLVISTWNNLERTGTAGCIVMNAMGLQEQVDDLLGETTQYRIYESLVGGIFRPG